jgi:transposase-like protein
VGAIRRSTVVNTFLGNKYLDSGTKFFYNHNMESVKSGLPETLQQVILYFSDPDNALAFAVRMRWQDGKPTCPRCASQENNFLATRRVWECKGCRKQFSVKQGSIFEDSAIPLDKWLTAMWMLATCKNGISSYEVSRDLAVSQKAAWFMLHRIRLAMQARSLEKKLCGEVEADETFIGGKLTNMHRRSKRLVRAGGGKNWGRAVVLGLLQRDGDVRAAVAPSRKKHHVHPTVKGNVEAGSTLYTDNLPSYDGLKKEFTHEFIDHAVTYVEGRVHTNGMENFWSLLKRGLKGTYVSVDPAHLQAYVDEQVFRFNNRKGTDLDRFLTVASSVAGKRLTWAELTGKGLDQLAG